MKFNQKNLANIDYLNVNPLGWTGDAKTDNLINILLHNYSIKFNEELPEGYEYGRFCPRKEKKIS